MYQKRKRINNKKMKKLNGLQLVVMTMTKKMTIELNMAKINSRRKEADLLKLEVNLKMMKPGKEEEIPPKKAG